MSLCFDDKRSEVARSQIRPRQMAASLPLSLAKSPYFASSTFLVGSPCLQRSLTGIRQVKGYRNTNLSTKRAVIVCGFVDPWAPTIDSQSIASQLFAFSLLPYIGFLYFITKSKSAPKLTLFGFYFLLAFVGATSEFFICSLLPFYLFIFFAIPAFVRSF